MEEPQARRRFLRALPFSPGPQGRGVFYPDRKMKLVLDARELATALSLPHTTVQQYASKFPDRLPPRMRMPSRKLMWAVADVEAWVEAHRAYAVPTPQPSGCSKSGHTDAGHREQGRRW